MNILALIIFEMYFTGVIFFSGFIFYDVISTETTKYTSLLFSLIWPYMIWRAAFG